MQTPPKILIGVPVGETSRHNFFHQSIYAMDKPHVGAISMISGRSPAASRNIIIRQALENNFTHILFLDDDNIPPQDVISRLLAHDVDMVTGLYLHHGYPHKPILFNNTLPDGSALYHPLVPNEHGLIKIENCGLGCVLIKIEVFRKVEAPWVALGQLDPENWCDDFYFFRKAQEAGFNLYCDLTVKVGHLGYHIVTPHYDTETNEWFTTYNTFGTGLVSIPTPQFSNDYESFQARMRELDNERKNHGRG